MSFKKKFSDKSPFKFFGGAGIRAISGQNRKFMDIVKERREEMLRKRKEKTMEKFEELSTIGEPEDRDTDMFRAKSESFKKMT